MSLAQLRQATRTHADPAKAKILQGFFKTGKGQYGEGDLFLGLTVPKSRSIAKKFSDLSFSNVAKLLRSPYHEERLIALLILAEQFPADPDRVYHFYLRHTKYVNNWDLVDLSADKIVGGYLIDKPTGILNQLARSKNVWDRRIAILATFRFIKAGRFQKTLDIAKLLLSDKHDLIHKAVGWMLREVGKRDVQVLVNFLDQNQNLIPRTALRYAIEKFPEKQRKKYLDK